MLCPLYEIMKGEVNRHEEIFKEILELRKKEFSLLTISHNIEGYMKLQSEMHHEINFIFQIANKNPTLLKNKKFLYIREEILLKSSQIKNILAQYNMFIVFYNRYIRIKNMSIIGLFLPFSRKETI
mgnify:CR=1 FL=1